MVNCGMRLSKTIHGEGSEKGCGVDWETWRATPEEMKMHLINELDPNWNIDKSNPNLMKCIDNIFKSRFWEWKFDNQRVAELQREPEPSADE
ncbi:hypothetical protein D8674_037983 [Pyrus ussuriensis x Pyrus communis]|uniref:Uncharacterized protein n=1 Tax=Pyrus ussuriensis x Pyrus communis TaxID=2448454 RepID=A0A5N5G0X8_9ROSA|nr:hypothetical protein D8674_039662 [Pyrus ussuriensis x Pyrus communis]KAB2604663.1 hypothetical protein D8674_037983 [Pyrus ussuriensis x Pyrus communis]